MFVLAAVDLTLGFVAWILIGALAGAAAGRFMPGRFMPGRFMPGRDFGPWGDLLIGTPGGIIGGWLLGLAVSGRDGLILTFFAALVGAFILVYALRTATRGRRFWAR